MSDNVIQVLSEKKFSSSPEKIKGCIAKVITQIKRFQERVRKHIEGNYIEFMNTHTSSDLYLEEGESLMLESENLMQTFGKDALAILQETTNDLTDSVHELQETTLGLMICYRILKTDDLFQCIEEASSAKEYLIMLELLDKLRNLIYSVNIKEEEKLFQKCECYQAIKVKYQIQSNVLKQNLQLRFEQLVQFTTKSYAHINCVTLKISKDTCQLQDTVVALFQAQYNPMKLCDFLMENCFKPLILKPVLLEYHDTSTDYVELSLSYSLQNLSISLRPPYKQVLQNIKTLLQCLSNINVAVSQDLHVFSIMGDYLRENFLTLLIEECLMHAIPETMDELKESSLVKDVLDFEQFISDNFLLDCEKHQTLCEFVKKFDTYFKTRICNKILENARDIMQKDLQDMISIGEKCSLEEETSNPLLFPRCMISKSTLELVKIMERILWQPVESEKDDTNLNLVKVVPLILNLYMAEVPKIHEKLLERIPQQSVLFYNNCMYLSYWIAKSSKNVIPSSPGLVKTLELTGFKYFNIQVSAQQQIIMDIIKELDLSETHTLGTAPFKLIRQCLRQLELLKNVWQNVLPETTYNKTFYNLLNELCVELIRRILVIEDISSTVAHELSELIEVVSEKVPLLLKEKSEVVHIKSWMKLEQLKYILNASLQEIVDQWCDGVGILSVNYKTDEIKHLIRALFQNTDRRAKALAKIV